MPVVCRDQILEAFPMTAIHGGCRDYWMYDLDAPDNNSMVDQASCHFANQLSLYAYQRQNEIFLDIKGMSGGRIVGHESEKNHTESFSSCDDLVLRIQDLSKLEAVQLPKAESRRFSSEESVLIVASQNDCRDLKDEIEYLLSIYKSERRSLSEILCIPTKVIQKRNPVDVRKAIQKKSSGKRGIILIGDDIPPFEYFYRTGYGDWGPYKWASTDLPYGSLSNTNPHWQKPLSKKKDWINEKLYRSKDFMYKIDYPTPYSFDFDLWVKHELDHPETQYVQNLWVSRILSADHKMKSNLQRFVHRREFEKPTQTLNMMAFNGSESFMLRAGEHQNFDYFESDWKNLRLAIPPQSQVLHFEEADLDQSIRFLDRNLTHLILSDHGQPQGFGNIRYNSFLANLWLPPFVHYSSCLVGAWGYADSVEASLISQSFDIEGMPIALVASQGIKSLVTVGPPTAQVREPLIYNLKSGQSLGNRQIESFQASLEHWKHQSPNHEFQGELPGNLFHSLSIFGDGTWEF